MSTTGTGSTQGEIMETVAGVQRQIDEVEKEFDHILTKLSPILEPSTPPPLEKTGVAVPQLAESPLARELSTMSSRLRKHHADLLNLKEKLNI